MYCVWNILYSYTSSTPCIPMSLCRYESPSSSIYYCAYSHSPLPSLSSKTSSASSSAARGSQQSQLHSSSQTEAQAATTEAPSGRPVVRMHARCWTLLAPLPPN